MTVAGSRRDAASESSVPHGFIDDGASRVLRARPPSQALAWVEEVLDVKVSGVRALRGGMSSAMHAVRVSSRLGAETVIMRRYVASQVNIEAADLAAHEARTLRLLTGSQANTPRLLAVDPTGATAGAPTVLMSRVPGRLDWRPNDLGAWVRGLVGVLPAVHDLRLGADHGIGDFTPYAPESWRPPCWMKRAHRPREGRRMRRCRCRQARGCLARDRQSLR